MPIISPFRTVDEQSLIKAGLEIPLNSKATVDSNYLSANVAIGESCSLFISTCANCQETGSLHCVDILNSYGFAAKTTVEGGRPAIFALLLCDCANTIALLSRPNANPPEKSYKIICAYLYDFQKIFELFLCKCTL